MSSTTSGYWVFSNKAAGAYGGSDWDMKAILSIGHYYLKQAEGNRAKVKAGDVVYMRVYGECYLGRFTVADEWQSDPEAHGKHEVSAGFFPMGDVVIWPRPVPQSLAINDLSTKDVRNRIVAITEKDALYLETAQRIYERLGFGRADGEIVLLEKGLEEAIKPNLAKMGLHLASAGIQQQFSMGPGVGVSDLICVDADGNLVVLELKRGRSSNEVIGQLLTYVGFVRENIAAPGQKVHGWIVTGDYDEKLRLAAAAAGVRVLVVRLP